ARFASSSAVEPGGRQCTVARREVGVTGFGAYSAGGSAPRTGWRDGADVVDLSALGDVYAQQSLNKLLALGRDAWADALAAAHTHDGPRIPLADATLHMPFEVADYID